MIIFLWLLLSLFACCCCLPLRYLLSHEWPKLRQMLYFPLSGQMRWEHRTQRTRLLRRLNGVEVTLTTADDRVVHAVWVPAPAKSGAAGACRAPMPSAPPHAPRVPPTARVCEPGQAAVAYRLCSSALLCTGLRCLPPLSSSTGLPLDGRPPLLITPLGGGLLHLLVGHGILEEHAERARLVRVRVRVRVR